MTLTARITGHPMWASLEQAETAVQNLSPQARQPNAVGVDRVTATLAYLRQVLQFANGDVIADGTLSNLHNWTQAITNELNNAQANPGQPQFLLNAINNADAISQNMGQIPLEPLPTALAGMAEEAQRRLDEMQTLETSVRERARAVTDQVAAELEKTRSAAADGLQRLKQSESQANNLLAALGARGTSTDYLVTAAEEKKAADYWRWGTLGLAVITGVASFFSGHDLSTHSASSITARVSIVLPLILLTVYAGRQAAEHRAQQRRARTLGLQLASLGAFLADLSDEGRNAIKSEVSRQLFATVDKDGVTLASGYPSSQELLQILATAIGKFPQLR